MRRLAAKMPRKQKQTGRFDWAVKAGTLAIAVLSLLASLWALQRDDAHFSESTRMITRQYEELTKPHTRHSETFDKLTRLDARLESVRESVDSLSPDEQFAESRRKHLVAAEEARDNAERAWRRGDYDQADASIEQAYDSLVKATAPNEDVAVTRIDVLPSEINSGETASVIVTLENRLSVAADYLVILRVDGSILEAKTVTLQAGKATQVTFDVTQQVGVHRISADRVSQTLTVRPLTPPGGVQRVNWWLVGAIIAGLTAIAATISMIVDRKND